MRSRRNASTLPSASAETYSVPSGPAAMPANGPCGPENGGMPFSGLGTTPGGGADRQPGRDGVRVPVLQIHGDQRLGAGVDDIQLPPVDQNALRAAQFGRHRLHAGSGELDHPPAPASETSQAAVGSDRDARPDRSSPDAITST